MLARGACYRKDDLCVKKKNWGVLYFLSPLRLIYYDPVVGEMFVIVRTKFIQKKIKRKPEVFLSELCLIHCGPVGS